MRISDWSSDVCSSDLAYLVQKNEYRVVQDTEEGETDFGLQLLECFIGTVRSAGLSPERTSIYTHMIRELLLSTAHRTTFETFPSQQRDELEKTIAKLSPETCTTVPFRQDSLLEIDVDRGFNGGVNLFLVVISR